MVLINLPGEELVRKVIRNAQILLKEPREIEIIIWKNKNDVVVRKFEVQIDMPWGLYTVARYETEQNQKRISSKSSTPLILKLFFLRFHQPQKAQNWAF
jgi:hypothetical protein